MIIVDPVWPPPNELKGVPTLFCRAGLLAECPFAVPKKLGIPRRLIFTLLLGTAIDFHHLKQWLINDSY